MPVLLRHSRHAYSCVPARTHTSLRVLLRHNSTEQEGPYQAPHGTASRSIAAGRERCYVFSRPKNPMLSNRLACNIAREDLSDAVICVEQKRTTQQQGAGSHETSKAPHSVEKGDNQEAGGSESEAARWGKAIICGRCQQDRRMCNYVGHHEI